MIFLFKMHFSAPPTHVSVLPSLYLYCGKCASFQVVIIDSFSMSSCNFGMPVGWGVLRVFLLCHLGQTSFFFLIYLLIYLWLCWVFVSVWGLFLVAASGGHSSSQCAGLSLLQPLLLQSTGSRRAGSVILAHGPSCSAACGIFPDQGTNPCPLHWQADSQPLRHQGSPQTSFIIQFWETFICLKICIEI